MIISIYVTDRSNSLIFQYLPDANSPTFNEFWTKIQYACPEIINTEDTLIDDSQNGDNNDNNTNENGEEYAKYIQDYNEIGHSNFNIHETIGKDLEVYKYYSKENSIYYWCLCSQDIYKGPLEPFVLLNRLDMTLLEYFDKNDLSIKKLINNSDRLSLIFYSFINGGEVNVGKLFMNNIRDNVPVKKDLSKVITSTAHTIQRSIQNVQTGGGSTRSITSNLLSGSNNTSNVSISGNGMGNNSSSGFGNSGTINNKVVPWRSGNVKYTNNEIYIDVIEEIHVVYQRRNSKRYHKINQFNRNDNSPMKLIRADIIGELNVRSYLSDNPMVEVTLVDRNYSDQKTGWSENDLFKQLNLGLPMFHDCVEIDYEKGINQDFRHIKFIPPDGKFSLMKYNIDLDNSISTTRQMGLISVEFQDGLGPKKDEFEVIVNIQNSTSLTHIKDLKVELYFREEKPLKSNSLIGITDDIPEGSRKISQVEDSKDNAYQTGSNDEAEKEEEEEEEDEEEEEEERVRVLRNTHGRFDTQTDGLSGSWIFDHETAVGSMPVLRGCTGSTQLKLSGANMTYEHGGVSASGIRVSSIDVIGLGIANNTKVFKGVKYETVSSNYELRV
ncbi:hypothetical protein TBLA_0I00620 [Henningerozyma blattae CBS 6284]|uniref:MHD domain-containing protein n=1 Tax=Henningerozyma blattae (strain ATCC 34711 / CBS 6284 / DSM 70876 / NBRC 10599 / NRRL Y-10934 / UCD 77-7) TaxID=1071380 RepID=I2H8L9_HENB6|nr:hypothetical protein TBLA_0I00620 [Tetrapisispora blattae CBS 6284]CCH62721.1 hypothetical protein TBLA_0I00620 [Tetrapisispora blattae CBS 6284]